MASTIQESDHFSEGDDIIEDVRQRNSSKKFSEGDRMSQEVHDQEDDQLSFGLTRNITTKYSIILTCVAICAFIGLFWTTWGKSADQKQDTGMRTRKIIEFGKHEVQYLQSAEELQKKIFAGWDEKNQCGVVQQPSCKVGSDHTGLLAYISSPMNSDSFAPLTFLNHNVLADAYQKMFNTNYVAAKRKSESGKKGNAKGTNTVKFEPDLNRAEINVDFYILRYAEFSKSLPDGAKRSKAIKSTGGPSIIFMQELSRRMMQVYKKLFSQRMQEDDPYEVVYQPVLRSGDSYRTEKEVAMWRENFDTCPRSGGETNDNEKVGNVALSDNLRFVGTNEPAPFTDVDGKGIFVHKTVGSVTGVHEYFFDSKGGLFEIPDAEREQNIAPEDGVRKEDFGKKKKGILRVRLKRAADTPGGSAEEAPSQSRYLELLNVNGCWYPPDKDEAADEQKSTAKLIEGIFKEDETDQKLDALILAGDFNAFFDVMRTHMVGNLSDGLDVKLMSKDIADKPDTVNAVVGAENLVSNDYVFVITRAVA